MPSRCFGGPGRLEGESLLGGCCRRSAHGARAALATGTRWPGAPAWLKEKTPPKRWSGHVRAGHNLCCDLSSHLSLLFPPLPDAAAIAAAVNTCTFLTWFCARLVTRREAPVRVPTAVQEPVLAWDLSRELYCKGWKEKTASGHEGSVPQAGFWP